LGRNRSARPTATARARDPVMAVDLVTQGGFARAVPRAVRSFLGGARWFAAHEMRGGPLRRNIFADAVGGWRLAEGAHAMRPIATMVQVLRARRGYPPSALIFTLGTLRDVSPGIAQGARG
jgi:hypothetical protein